MSLPFRFACPHCRATLEEAGVDVVRCPVDDRSYTRRDGIWRFLLPERESLFRQFIDDYETIRAAEGRNFGVDATYRALPYVDAGQSFASDWQIRAQSYETFLAAVLIPLEGRWRRSFQVLDLGAGNGWLSNRLSARDHAVAAIDLIDNDFDGLGCYSRYETNFTPVQAEFDRLPFADGTADIVIFNASLHYSSDYETTLAEARRALRADGPGLVVIVDTPIYHDPASGEAMTRERREYFSKKYGFPSDTLKSENYLTPRRLTELSDSLGVSWTLHWPVAGWRRQARRWRGRLRQGREPGQFAVIVGRQTEGG